MKEVPLSKVKDDLSRFLREAETQDVVITPPGKPAGVLIGFKSEDDWFDYRLESDPRFLQRVEPLPGARHDEAFVPLRGDVVANLAVAMQPAGVGQEDLRFAGHVGAEVPGVLRVP